MPTTGPFPELVWSSSAPSHLFCPSTSRCSTLLFYVCFPNKTPYAPLFSHIRATCHKHLVRLDLFTRKCLVQCPVFDPFYGAFRVFTNYQRCNAFYLVSIIITSLIDIKIGNIIGDEDEFFRYEFEVYFVDVEFWVRIVISSCKLKWLFRRCSCILSPQPEIVRSWVEKLKLI